MGHGMTGFGASAHFPDLFQPNVSSPPRKCNTRLHMDGSPRKGWQKEECHLAAELAASSAITEPESRIHQGNQGNHGIRVGQQSTFVFVSNLTPFKNS